MSFELKDATLEGITGEGFAVVLGAGEQQRCEGRIVFEDAPGPDVIKSIVDGSELTYEGPVYHGDDEYRKSIPVVSRKADFEAEQPYVDFETTRSGGDSGRSRQQHQRARKRQQRGRSRQGGGVGDVTVHEK